MKTASLFLSSLILAFFFLTACDIDPSADDAPTQACEFDDYGAIYCMEGSYSGSGCGDMCEGGTQVSACTGTVVFNGNLNLTGCTGGFTCYGVNDSGAEMCDYMKLEGSSGY